MLSEVETTHSEFRTCIIMQFFVKCFAENLLDRSVDETWPTDTNLNRVSVIHFRDDSKHEEEDEETADKRVICRNMYRMFMISGQLFT